MRINKNWFYQCLKDLPEMKFSVGKIYTSCSDGHLINDADEKVYIPEDKIEEHFSMFLPSVKVVAERLMDSSKSNVDHPGHYASGDIECIDAMIAAYGVNAVKWFCICNAFKYQWRFNKKNGVEDIKKAQWYQNKLIELIEKSNPVTN